MKHEDFERNELGGMPASATPSAVRAGRRRRKRTGGRDWRQHARAEDGRSKRGARGDQAGPNWGRWLFFGRPKPLPPLSGRFRTSALGRTKFSGPAGGGCEPALLPKAHARRIEGHKPPQAPAMRTPLIRHPRGSRPSSERQGSTDEESASPAPRPTSRPGPQGTMQTGNTASRRTDPHPMSYLARVMHHGNGPICRRRRRGVGASARNERRRAGGCGAGRNAGAKEDRRAREDEEQGARRRTEGRSRGKKKKKKN